MSKPILALTLHQPWAHLVAIGAKQFETRSWSTPYRGWLIIHAGGQRQYMNELADSWASVQRRAEENGKKTPTRKSTSSGLTASFERACISALVNAGVKDAKEITFGAMIAVAHLEDCLLMTDELIAQQSPDELTFGWWKPGRYAWKLSAVRRITPILYRGRQGLWQVPDDLVLSLNWHTAEEEQAIRASRQPTP